MSNDLNALSGASPKPVTPMMRAKKVTQALLLTAVVIFLAGAGGVYLILSKIQATQKRATERAALAGNSQQIASRYQATMDTYNQTEDQLHFLEASVSQQEFVPTLLQQLQSLATTTQLTVTSVRPGPIADATASAAHTITPGGTPSDDTTKKPAPLPYTVQPITLSVSGTYPQLMRFVYSLPHFPKILSLHSVSLHPDTTGPADPKDAAASKGAEPKLSAEIVLDAYVFNADPTPVAAAEPQPGSFSDQRKTQNDVMSDAAGRAVGGARQDAQTANTMTAQTPIAAPVGTTPVAATPITAAPVPVPVRH